ncbi:transposase [Bradyrhizobium japonicum]|nr:transposase [Bradyrhizobium japonicum]MCP1865416.1 transposase [Bradyrhizobium japonicum]MCP1895812.1 transposase [Bradyrhizobium japonicum]MCW2329195.1 transposase [Bradyrhizobium japonicum]
MMGHRRVEQAALFYEFSLERHIPADHLLRSIDRFVDLEEIRRDLAPFSIGRPSIDPELMIRMLLIGYCFGIRSERRLCDEVHLNLAYRWFCRLGLDGAVPDHSTFSKNRHGRFRESDLFRRVFASVLGRRIEERLVGGEGFAVDARLIKADANRQKGIDGDKGLSPEAAARAIDEYLAVLDDAAFGAATEVTPKFVSPSDPAARWTGAHGGQAFFAYSTNYLVDIENAIIVDVEATTAIRQAEVLAAKRMIERSLERFDLYPNQLLGDSGYGSAEILAWLVYEHGIEPHVTVFDKSARTDGIFSRDDFTYDHAGDVYRCPSGKVLTTTRTLVNDGATMLHLASKRDCDRCALKSRCCPKQASRKVPRSIYEALATWRARSQDRGRAALRVGSARRLRCCSRTSSAFSNSTVYVYEVQTAR